MKQHISRKQWEELTKKQKKVLSNNFRDEDGELILSYCSTKIEKENHIAKYAFLINIGQMIEFLKQEDIKEPMYIDEGFQYVIKNPWSNVQIGWDHYEELCDALFEAVKYKLESN